MACAIVLLAAHNVVIERLARWMYVPACLTTAAALVIVGTAAGLGAADMGLAPRGLGIGLLAAPAIALLVAIAAAMRRTRPLFADRRMVGVGSAGTAYRAAVRIPLGTVLLEEVAFRGVLLALLGAVVPVGWAVAATCVLFGLWHVVPTASALDVNGIAKDRTRLLVGTVAVMALGGALLCSLRVATGSVAGPAVVHASATATATVAAHLVQRSARSSSVQRGARSSSAGA